MQFIPGVSCEPIHLLPIHRQLVKEKPEIKKTLCSVAVSLKLSPGKAVKGLAKTPFPVAASSAALAVLCGLILWATSLGEPWINASYDYSFRFGAHAVTNSVALILMDNDAFDHLHQPRGQPWDRALHAQLLNKLADDGCGLAVFDSFFKELRDPVSDDALAAAIRRQRRVALMAEQSPVNLPGLAGVEPVLPDEKFLSAAGHNFGVAWLKADPDGIVRKHWPFPSPDLSPSLPETVAKLSGARPDAAPRERWLRYYGEKGAWPVMGYRFALAQPANYFRGKIVFIGTQPKTSMPDDGELDEFSTPYTGWSRESSGGVEIMITEFLNLMNGDWLRRPAAWVELVTLIFSGIFLGAGLCRLKPLAACGAAAVFFGVVALAAVSWSFYSNYWFPWLIISGAQMPCALATTLAARFILAAKTDEKTKFIQKPPVTPGYELFQPPIGEGAYGRVWLARSQAGQWRALKAIYLANFNQNNDPYEREFNGVSRYKAVSGDQPGLLKVDFVSEKQDGYFYYVMELGDSLSPGWQKDPAKYKPHDLAAERARAPENRLPARECVRLGLVLAEALESLHQHGLTHRDIKPQNIIFVDGRPKLADLGLIAEIRPADQIKTFVGTPGFMPPPPELPGTPQADIFALGMVLYVMSTGHPAALFPDISTSLVDNREPAGFLPLNALVLKACQPNPASRYASAAEMHRALLALKEKFDQDKAGPAC
ncbi:MAG TPA: serine/threonine-protein kinase [Verrucomicrobiae bacterium]